MLTVIRSLPESLLPFPWAGMRRAISVGDDQGVRVRAQNSGLFLPAGQLWAAVEAGEVLGEVIEPTTGAIIERIVSPVSGRLFAVRERPAVFSGSMVARVVRL